MTQTTPIGVRTQFQFHAGNGIVLMYHGICGIKKWTPDILRHTRISNHLASIQHEGKTAAWAGNSPDIIQRHYKGLVKQADAKEFWTIKP